MSTLLRLVCIVFGHTTPPGVRRDLSFRFECGRCRACVDGHLALRRR